MSYHDPKDAPSAETKFSSNSVRQMHSTDELHHNTVRRLRLLCLFHGSHGILDLGRTFRKLDKSGKGLLKETEFTAALAHTGLELDDGESHNLFKKLDHDRNGWINIGEFLVHVRPPLSESRKEIIDQAFKKMDTEDNGSITLDTLRHYYNVKTSTLYLSGEKSESSMVQKFLLNFERGAVDEKVSHEEFANYYGAVSTSIDNDCFFDLMMRQAYKL